MANPTCTKSAGAILPVSPYLGLFFHFGMLLGVDDLETGQAYHRGKMRLHNAWQHGQGVAWGFGVEMDAGKGAGEIRVLPGLAIDAAGRELHLDGPACLNIGAWVDAHRDDHDFRAAAAVYDPTIDVPAEGDTEPPEPLPPVVQFDAHVVVKFKACLTRPVPAISSTCAGSEAETAFSRVSETIEILLVPGAPPAEPRAYHLLRLLFSLDDPETDEGGATLPDDIAVIAKRNAILDLPLQEQPKAYLEAFREVAAMDEIKLSPATRDGARLLFPADDDAIVLLAKIPGIKLDQGAYVSGGPVDPSIRPVLVPTTTIQELLNGPLFGVRDAGGPRVTLAALVKDGVTQQVNGVTVVFTVEVAPASVTTAGNPGAFSVTYFDGTGWHAVNNLNSTPQGPTQVDLTFDPIPLAWDRIRVRARGTGAAPIMNTWFVPLAGAQGDPPAGGDEGRDYVHMFSPTPMS